ncbi:isocitrate lyase/PEP mutase family protein [Novosphingobium terrae]|uniref:isocitrate lyase/PEP mutase family protein n=1 Tax=Novosphingobium terrae TaxID=2726189 RepID=UPI00197ECA7D|nr:isocitrate lyase/phosphoenolpyruvate mutase family protein [Novosphingobium terrae]
MTQSEQAAAFAGLHRPGQPISLYNVWDAGSARAVAAAGARAIATSSWAVAAAQGFRDGEDLPLDRLLDVAGRITAAVDLPVSVDFEGGYAEGEEDLARNIGQLLERGAIGINFEDRVVQGEGLYSVDRQAQRIGALRRAAEQQGIALFINARTDLFLGQAGDPALSIDPALDRARAYAEAGASGFFIPGLIDEALIARICAGSPLPVNVMMMEGAPSANHLARLGVARISYGATPYAETMKALEQRAQAIPSQA